MKQKLAGHEIDILSSADLEQAIRGMQAWMVDVARGCRPIRFNGQGTADSTGLVQLGGPTTLVGGRLGPNEGNAWAVTRMAVRIDGQPAAFSIYVGGPHTNSLIRDVTSDANGYLSFGAQELLLVGGDNLYLRGASIAPNTGVCTVSGAAVEIPNQLMWKWLAG